MEKKIKILFAINNLNLGGAEVVVTEQIKNIDHEKFSAHLATLYRSKEPNLLSRIDFLNKESFKQFNFKSKNVLNPGKWLAVYKFLKKEKFDVIYSHLFESNMIFRSLAYVLKIPVIVSFEHSEYFNKSRWQIVVDKILSLITDKIIVSTKTVADFTAKQEKIKIDKFVVIPNPISLPDKEKINLPELKKNLNLGDKDFVVLFLGRFSEEKGLDYLLKAFKEIIKVQENIKLVMVGYGPLEKKLRQGIRDQNLEKYCQIIAEPLKAKDFLFLGDIFVLTSLREGQSMATYEALMSGLPVVAFAVGGVKDIIKTGDNGFLSPIGDANSLAKNILYLYNNSSERQAMAKRAKESVRQCGVEDNIKFFERLVFSLFKN